MQKKKIIYAFVLAIFSSYGCSQHFAMAKSYSAEYPTIDTISPSSITINKEEMTTGLKKSSFPIGAEDSSKANYRLLSSNARIDDGFTNQFVYVQDINLKVCLINSLNNVIKQENETLHLQQPLISLPAEPDKTDAIAYAIYQEKVLNLPITQSQADKLTYLHADHKNIYNLAGLEYFRNLEEVHLGNNPLAPNHFDEITMQQTTDPLAPLALLPKLHTIDLINCNLEDITALHGLAQYGTIKALYLSNNRISNLLPLSHLTSLTTLDLYYNSIYDINDLDSLTNLTFLDLGNNFNYDFYDGIWDVTALSSLVNLTELNLEQSFFLDDITPLEALTKLQKLNLNNCYAYDFSAVCNLPELQELYVENNTASSLVILNSPHLKIISAEGNPLNIIEIRNCPLTSLNIDFTGPSSIILENLNLRVLELASSTLTHIEFSGLNQLEELRIIGLPTLDNYDFLLHLPSLQALDFWNIPLDSPAIQSMLSNLSTTSTHLQRLYFGNTQLSDISFLNKYTSLTCLTILDNPITSIAPLKDLRNLKELYIRRSLVTDISPVTQLPQLEFLSLGENQITNLPNTINLPNLKGLSLPHNHIQNISSVHTLRSLLYLNLSHNKIEDITPIQTLTSINRLNLRHNNINDVSALYNLKELDFNYNSKWYWIQGNPLSIPITPPKADNNGFGNQPNIQPDNDSNNQPTQPGNDSNTTETPTTPVVPPVVVPPVVAPPVVAPPVVAPPVVAPPVVAPPVVAPPVVAPPVVAPPVVVPPVVVPSTNTTNNTSKSKTETNSNETNTSKTNTSVLQTKSSSSPTTTNTLSIKLGKKTLYLNSTLNKKTTYIKTTLPQNYTCKYFNCSPKLISLNKKNGKITGLKTGTAKVKVNIYKNKKYVKTQYLTVSIKKKK